MSEETRVRALTTVPLPPDEAFALFTEEVDSWWRHGPRFRAAIDGKEGVMRFEPGEGGGCWRCTTPPRTMLSSWAGS